MRSLKAVLNGYQKIESSLLYAIAAQFCIQFVNTAFFILLNYYMANEGFADFEIAHVISYRFLAAFTLAFPVGLFIKGRRLKPVFYTAAILVPVSSHLMILSIDHHWDLLLNISTMLWGIGYTLIQVTILPFLLLNGKEAQRSEAFSLSFLSFSSTIFIVGAANYLLNSWRPDIFDEQLMLQAVATISALGIYFVWKIDIKEQLSERVPFRKVRHGYDWKLIFEAIIPTFIIAVGAGFTIPVINLFFLNVHGVDSRIFSVLGSITYFMVACVMIFMPTIKRNFGYRIAITLFQSTAVLALLLMATTEYYKGWSIALPLAIFFYIIRQPLMNAAGPMTSELIMYYVGNRNQEIIAALNASIWSGSWFVSMQLFGWMRQMNFAYVTIFLITVGLYAIGVSWYAVLIRKYESRRKAEKIRSKKMLATA